MYCPNCGALLNADAKFCEYCGTQVTGNNDNDIAPAEQQKAESVSTDNKTTKVTTYSSDTRCYLGLAIFSLLMFFFTGIAAIIFACKARNASDIYYKTKYANTAKTLSIIGIIIGLITLIGNMSDSGLI